MREEKAFRPKPLVLVLDEGNGFGLKEEEEVEGEEKVFGGLGFALGNAFAPKAAGAWNAFEEFPKLPPKPVKAEFEGVMLELLPNAAGAPKEGAAAVEDDGNALEPKAGVAVKALPPKEGAGGVAADEEGKAVEPKVGAVEEGKPKALVCFGGSLLEGGF